ncbi:hypothetical protein PACTADRAFT_4497 [Pachysolen tannophilus NRRL Y-2460]|uniref:Uncharacterized protein n=1 Tax=Pachysolen tannophilus NRRL Y-2460 TaxID=669874 RepID=A0A1E4TPA8_PACTA|nr:hypothetical protein PACTADRAFT_4497 [Pachysolen tannophilus NRRL Y-2460]
MIKLSLRGSVVRRVVWSRYSSTLSPENNANETSADTPSNANGSTDTSDNNNKIEPQMDHKKLKLNVGVNEGQKNSSSSCGGSGNKSSGNGGERGAVASNSPGCAPGSAASRGSFTSTSNPTAAAATPTAAPAAPAAHTACTTTTAADGLDKQGGKNIIKVKARYNLNSLPRVPSTSNISHSTLFNDLLINNHMPLLSPVVKNHSESTKLKKLKSSKNSSVLNNLAKFKESKKQILMEKKTHTNYYNVYLNKQNVKLPYNSIFCNTALNTQQHNLEMFNLPLNYLEKLKPFQLINKPGDEFYRDDLIVVNKIEIEERENIAKEKAKREKGTIFDIEEFFGFKDK